MRIQRTEQNATQPNQTKPNQTKAKQRSATRLSTAIMECRSLPHQVRKNSRKRRQKGHDLIFKTIKKLIVLVGTYEPS